MNPLTILLVDDDPLVRNVIAEEIREAGHQVVPVKNGHEALAALVEDSFDIALIDYAMPGMMGVEVANRARAAQPKLPIAILTGYGELLEVSGRNGEFPVIGKGRMNAILDAIVAVAGGETLPPASSPESRWEAIQRRMAVTSNSKLVGQTLRNFYNEPPDEPLPDKLAALLGEAPADVAPANGSAKPDAEPTR